MNERAIERAKVEINNLLSMNTQKMIAAYIESDDELSVSLTAKFAPGRAAGSVEVAVTINFVESRTKLTVKTLVDDKQQGLFSEPKGGVPVKDVARGANE